MDRKYKGKSIVDFPSDYVVVDVETTGLDYRCCYMIEVCAIRYKNGQKVDTFSSLIQPPKEEIYDLDPDTDELYMVEEYFVSDFITNLTGITNEMLESAPTEDNVIPEVLRFIGDSVLVGHNVNFDVNFLYDAAEAYDLIVSNNFIDTLRIAKKVFPELTQHRLSDIAAACSSPITETHRALPDCEATAFCFNCMKDIISSKMLLEDFCQLFNMSYSASLKGIVRTTDSVDETNPLYNKKVVFTGTLDKMPRKAALQIVANLGGIPENSLNKHTNMLVIGNGEFVASVKNGKTNKMKKAEDILQKGGDIQIMSEDVFFELISPWRN